jgi:hypothetical protein
VNESTAGADMPPLENAQGVSMSSSTPPLNRAPPPSLCVSEVSLPCRAAVLSPSLVRWVGGLREYHSTHTVRARRIRDSVDRIEQHAREMGGWRQVQGAEPVASDDSTAVANAPALTATAAPASSSSAPTPLTPSLVRALLSRHALLVSCGFFSSVRGTALDVLVDAVHEQVAHFGRVLNEERKEGCKARKRPRSRPSAVEDDPSLRGALSLESARLRSLDERLHSEVNTLDAERDAKRNGGGGRRRKRGSSSASGSKPRLLEPKPRLKPKHSPPPRLHRHRHSSTCHHSRPCRWKPTHTRT